MPISTTRYDMWGIERIRLMVSAIVARDRSVDRPAQEKMNNAFGVEELAYPSSIYGLYGI
jgi:hypothetical protein